MIPGLPRGVRSAVYRRIVEQLRTDPVLSNVVKTWETWDRPSEPQIDAITTAPALRVMPVLGSVAWYSPDAQFGPLQLRYELYLEGVDGCDALDVQDALERAIYPADIAKQRAFQRDLVNLGCHTGLITFSQPAAIQAQESDMVMCPGLMQIEIVRGFNPGGPDAGS